MINNKTTPLTARLTGTAILAALVLVFDYTLKFSGLKIPFPWMPFLKFDFTGIPIIIALLLYGLPSATTTSIVASLGIIARSGDLIGGSAKGVAELSMVIGVAVGLKLLEKANLRKMTIVFVIGIFTRIIVMSVWNLLILPNFYGIPFNTTIGMLPLLALFNAMQGAITMFLGYFLYQSYLKRVRNAYI
jgi:riboflavin transporter FmnP